MVTHWSLMSPRQKRKHVETKRRLYQKSESYRKKSIAKNMDRYREHAAFVSGYLEAHPCVDCGERDPDVLTFDHVRGQKLFNIGSSILRPIPQLEAEMQKCDIRCANCHLRKSKRDGDYRPKRVRGLDTIAEETPPLFRSLTGENQVKSDT